MAAAALCVFALNKIAQHTVLSFNLQTIFLSLLAIFGVLIISFAMPARIIMKLSPAQAMKTE